MTDFRLHAWLMLHIFRVIGKYEMSVSTFLPAFTKSLMFI